MYRSITHLSDDELINIAFDYAKENREFKPNFIYKMKEVLEEYGSLKDGQRNSLEKIIETWNMI